MRILVVEFVTGGGLAGGPLSEGLVREGDMMLDALLADLGELPGVAVVATRDARLGAGAPAADLVAVAPGEDAWTVWRREAVRADAVWPVAPETGGALARLTELVVASGRTLLASRADAVRVATSKRATARLLGAPPDRGEGWVAKPDDGAGCEDTRLFADRSAAHRWVAGRADAGRFLVQPYVPGPAVSLSLLCAGGRAELLSVNRQDVSVADGGVLHLAGVAVGAGDGRRAALSPVAARVAAALPGLWGYVGVDLIDRPAAPVVLDVNPRLTLSYAGLSAHLGANVAGRVLALAAPG